MPQKKHQKADPAGQLTSAMDFDSAGARANENFSYGYEAAGDLHSRSATRPYQQLIW
jgi:hypothetical protein